MNPLTKMSATNICIIFILCGFSLVVGYDDDLYAGIDLSDYIIPEDADIVRAVVETCDGCLLKKRPEIKAFIFEDLPFFHNVETKFINEALPELVLLNKSDEEVERIPLDQNDRDDCNQLLLSLGFYRKDSVNGPVPDKYLHGPYKPLRDEL